jgi:starch phosphorylase
MSTLTPRFSSNRMLREYIERLYLPAAASFAARQDPENARHLCAWQEAIERHWDGLHFGELHCEADAGSWRFSIPVYLGELDAGFVAVQLHAMGRGSMPAELHPMARGEPLAGAVNGYTYTVSVPGTRPSGDYTPRVVPVLAGARVPLEAARILWLR